MAKKQVYIMSACLPVTVMLVIFMIQGVTPFGNSTVMAIDFASQYIDLFAYMKRAVLELDFSSLFYSFSKSLGGDMLGLWGYYLLSPFNLIYVLVPYEQITLAATLTILARYSAMGLTFTHLLIKRYNAMGKRPMLIPVFATIYALTGFNVAYQMNPLWYDAMVMLPLVIIGVETVLDGGKGIKYSVLLALSIIFQYYMAYMMCLFIVLYSFIYMARNYNGKKWTEKVMSYCKPIIRLGMYSILGVGLSAIVLIPIVQNLLISKGSYTESLTFLWKFEFNPLDILSKLFIGAFDYDQMPAGLPNVYIASLGLVGFCLFFTQKQFRRFERIMLAVVMFIFIVSMAHDFSNKIWHLGQTPAWFYHRFTYLTSFLMVLMGYRTLKDIKTIPLYTLIMGFGAILIMNGIVYQNQFSFMSIGQQLISSALWLFVLGILYVKRRHFVLYGVLFLVTILELGLNAYIDQSRIGYAHAGAFLNAQVVQKQVIDTIRTPQNDFYRIAKLYNRTKNDPFMFNYPGLTHFSSTMEAATLDLFDYLGDAGSNAATNYGSGTPLTDALYGVKYIVQMKNLPEELRGDANIYSFTRESTRKDLYAYYQSVSETDRLRVYQNNNVLSIGFGVSQAVIDVTFDKNSPAQNQNKILQAMAGTKEEYFKQYAFNDIHLDNFETDNPNDLSSVSLTRIDKDKPASIRYTFTPQTKEAYYISVPATLNKSKNDIQLTLNDKVYEYYPTFDHRQLWNIAYDNQNQETTFKVSTSKLNELNIFNIQLWKLDGQAIRDVIANRMKQNMTVTHWHANTVEGHINITDNSTYMMTSIPYSPGWQVWVDNKPVETVKVWESLLAIPISAGSHTIKMVYIPVGLWSGLAVSIVSGVILSGIYYRRKKHENI
ncbi:MULTISPECIES: YfhO family protein [unclassified Granulicatella]|uniref:YfhO family protein n=1 Tax=unclassified Granulicatella TaxID=2630493 RepID=UPI001431F2E7|nr:MULTISPECIES: YfhO family protein [unclassified Granulicatella]MBF0781054.1 YfhO family protein [Granulicatella sp. 19428wC4_WM01]